MNLKIFVGALKRRSRLPPLLGPADGIASCGSKFLENAGNNFISFLNLRRQNFVCRAIAKSITSVIRESSDRNSTAVILHKASHCIGSARG